MKLEKKELNLFNVRKTVFLFNRNLRKLYFTKTNLYFTKSIMFQEF